MITVVWQSTFAEKRRQDLHEPGRGTPSYDCLYMQMGEESQKEQKEVLKSVGISEEWTPKLWKRFMELNEWMAKQREPWVYEIQKYPYVALTEGETFSYGDYDFWVISLRGHTYGQRGLYDAKHRIAFTADQVMEGITPIVGTTQPMNICWDCISSLFLDEAGIGRLPDYTGTWRAD